MQKSITRIAFCTVIVWMVPMMRIWPQGLASCTSLYLFWVLIYSWPTDYWLKNTDFLTKLPTMWWWCGVCITQWKIRVPVGCITKCKVQFPILGVPCITQHKVHFPVLVPVITHYKVQIRIVRSTFHSWSTQ